MNKYINATTLLRYLEKSLGYRFEDLEISAEEMMDNIKQETLPMFSKFYPYPVRHLINPQKDLVEGFENRYYIKMEEPYTCFGVNKAYLNSSGIDTGALMGIQTINNSTSVQSQILADLISGSVCPTTFQYFDEDNSIEIYPSGYVNSVILIEAKCIHLEDFSTIPFTLHDEFKKLALYDTQIALLPLRRRFSNLSTAFGNIELFISDLEEANSKRDELLENWRKNFYKSPKRKKIYIG